jgi:hypothetical protein
VPKSRGRKAHARKTQPRTTPAVPAPLQPLSLGYNPAGRMETRDVVGSKDGWSEYTLDDGSVLRAKAIVLDVKRAVDQFNLDGDPIYVMQLTVVNQVKAPEHLRKKG